MTTYTYDVEETNILGRNYRRGFSSQDSSRLARIVLGVYGVFNTHASRVLGHRSTLLMLTAMCVFAVTLSMVIYISLSLTD